MNWRVLSSNRYFSISISIYFFIFAFAISFFAYRMPARNWDMVAYVASINHLKGFRGEALSKATYDDVQRSVSASQFRKLTRGSYRSTVYKEPRALSEQLPFYEIKPLYLATCWLVSFFDTSISNATVIVSAFFGGLFVLVSSFFLRKNAGYISIFLPPLLLSIGIFELSRLSTPDMFSSTIGLFGVLTSEKRPKLGLILLSIVPAIRPDYIIFNFLFTLIIIFHKDIKIFAAASFLFSFVAIMFIKHYFHGYNYPLLFNFSFIYDHTPYPLSIHISRNFLSYLHVYLRLKQLLLSNFFHTAFFAFLY